MSSRAESSPRAASSPSIVSSPGAASSTHIAASPHAASYSRAASSPQHPLQSHEHTSRARAERARSSCSRYEQEQANPRLGSFSRPRSHAWLGSSPLGSLPCLAANISTAFRGLSATVSRPATSSASGFDQASTFAFWIGLSFSSQFSSPEDVDRFRFPAGITGPVNPVGNQHSMMTIMTMSMTMISFIPTPIVFLS